jgi:uroporphyrinogen III methyltransferase/synthase
MPAESAISKPLLNLKILVACSAKKMVELVSGLEAMGGTVLPLPLIDVQEIKDKQPLDAALASLKEYAWILFTSAHGVAFFVERWIETENRVSAQAMPKICAIGPATARALKEYGLDVALIPERFVAEGVLEALERHHGGLHHLDGTRILLPRAKEARDVLPVELTKAGARVDVIACYETAKAEVDEGTIRQLRAGQPDLAVFTSSSTVRNLVDLLGQEDGVRILTRSTVAVLGPVTGSTVEGFGKSPNIVPEQNTIASLIEAIRDHYSKR